MPDQVPPEVVSERYQRLIALQERICLTENRNLIGTEVELLVAADSGRKSADTGRLTGRARDGRLVHFRAGDAADAVRPGDIVVTTVTDAAPHHLIADGTIASHRRTRAGDAHELDATPTTAPVGVGLGMPGVGPSPMPTAVSTGCSSGACG